ncbi:hypothetical protein ACF0H5_002523 [Mactra antiquata]
MTDQDKMECYLALLEAQSRQSRNDIRWGHVVAYVNTFLRRFGSEKVYLVGSTGEKSKLTFSKDDGDADFLMVSGMYGIDVTQLEFNKNTECFLRVKCNQESEKIGLDKVDGYISANTLREIKPELFTILRGIYSHVTSGRYRLSDIGSDDTYISVPSKVGLASIRYRHLNLDEALLDWLKQYQYDDNREEETRRSLHRRWQDVPIHDSDIKILRRVLRIIQMIVGYGGNVVKSNSQLFHFAGLLDDLTKRSSMAATRLLNSENSDQVLEEMHEAKSVKNIPDLTSKTPELDIDFGEMRNTYKEKYHMDFVPAIRLNQKLDLMEDWRQRVSDAGIDITLVDDICNTDIFVVSKVSPINPQSDTDFCLSFNIAEKKLVTNMTPLQRKIFLCMKAFLKGVFDKTHKENNHEVKLKTFHIKHSLFWHYELNPDSSVIEDTPENVLKELKRAIVFIRQKLEDQMLPHYFIGRNANLLAGFEDIDYKLLRECCTMVLNDPIEGLQIYSDLDDGVPCDIVLSREEIECLMTMTKDGGRNSHIDRLEDALIDIHRGFNIGPRDDAMRAPIKEAILDIFRLFLKDEQIIDTRVFEQINKFIKQGKTDSVPEVNEKVRNIATLLQSIGILFPTVKQFVDRFDGRSGIEEFLRGAFTGDPLDFTRDIDEQILQTVDKYLSCNEEEESVVAGELVYKLVGFFFLEGQSFLDYLIYSEIDQLNFPEYTLLQYSSFVARTIIDNMTDPDKMECYLALLEAQSRQSNNDISWGQTVAYINTFLRRFGSEKVHLVGSTGEKSKLTFSKDDGDADFLMVSGMYGIDVTQLEFDKNTECFLRVKCNQESEKIGLDTIDGYISANTLREFKRELFTILRGIHSYVTSVLRCRLSDAESEDTLIPVPSKVGLASIRYRHLNLDEALLDWFKQYQYDYNREETRISLQRQWQDVPIHESDMKVLRRVLRIIQMIGRYGDNVVKSNSQLFHFASLLDDLTKRSSMAATRTLESETFDPGLEEAQEAKSVIDSPHMASEPPEVDIDFEEMRNTYTEKFHMDFVPAIKLNQKLDLMEDWRQRVSDAGIDIALVDDICNTDIFVVSKVSPINPQSDTDFCLSFNLAEMKLVSNMTPLQRKIFLCMKAFLKGVFDKTHKDNNHEVKLKTFHIKHSLFWHFELNPDLSVIEDTPENVLNEIKCAIVCILQRLEDQMLPHYFIGRNANLLADFEDIDYKLLCECFTMVLNDPIGGLQIYCDLDDGAPCDIVLSREEIQCLMTMTKDGGRIRHIDRLEDALIDIHRGFNLGPRDDDMRAPIKEAI